MTTERKRRWRAAGVGLAVATGVAVACGGELPQLVNDEPPTLRVTSWTERTELFAEYPPPVQGETVRFAVHLTDLTGFSPMEAVRPRIELQDVSGRELLVVPA